MLHAVLIAHTCKLSLLEHIAAAIAHISGGVESRNQKSIRLSGARLIEQREDSRCIISEGEIVFKESEEREKESHQLLVRCLSALLSDVRAFNKARLSYWTHLVVLSWSERKRRRGTFYAHDWRKLVVLLRS